MALGGSFFTALSISKLQSFRQGPLPSRHGARSRPLQRLKPPLCDRIFPCEYGSNSAQAARTGQGSPGSNYNDYKERLPLSNDDCFLSSVKSGRWMI